MWQLVNSARCFDLERRLTTWELARAEEASSDPRIAAAGAKTLTDETPPRIHAAYGVLTFHGSLVRVEGWLERTLGPVIALYNAAYDPGLASLSVGIVSHAWAIREAIARRYATYDLLRGDEPYKYDLGAHDRWLGRLDAEAV